MSGFPSRNVWYPSHQETKFLKLCAQLKEMYVYQVTTDLVTFVNAIFLQGNIGITPEVHYAKYAELILI